MEVNQNFTTQQGAHRLVRYTVANGAGASDAEWYCAFGRNSPMRLLSKTKTAGEVTLTDAGTQLLVDVELTGADTESLPIGALHCEVWTNKSGKFAPRAEGVMVIKGSLRAEES